jgi:hypothetical protein
MTENLSWPLGIGTGSLGAGAPLISDNGKEYKIYATRKRVIAVEFGPLLIALNWY